MTATSSKLEKIHLHSPPRDLPGSPNVGGATIEAYTAPVPDAPSEVASPASRKARLSPVLNLQPVALNALPQWGIIAGLAAWAVVSSSGSPAGVGAAVALVVAGLLQMLIVLRINRGVVSQRGGQAIANLAFLLAVCFTGMVGATLVSPVVLLIPALVWTLAATSPKPWMATLGSRVAILVTAVIAVLSASRFAENPTPAFQTVAMGVTLAVATLGAAWHGRQVGPRLLETTLADATPVDSPSAIEPLDVVRLEIAGLSDPAGIAAAAAAALDRRLLPSYIAIVERVPEGHSFVPLTEVVNDMALTGLGRKLAGITESALSKGSALWILDDTDQSVTVTCRRMGIHAALIVPLEHLSNRIGAIQIAWTDALGPAALAEALSFSTELARLVTPDLAIAQFSSGDRARLLYRDRIAGRPGG